MGAAVADHDAVAALFARHYVPMCRLAYLILGDAGPALVTSAPAPTAAAGTAAADSAPRPGPFPQWGNGRLRAGGGGGVVRAGGPRRAHGRGAPHRDRHSPAFSSDGRLAYLAAREGDGTSPTVVVTGPTLVPDLELPVEDADGFVLPSALAWDASGDRLLLAGQGPTAPLWVVDLARRSVASLPLGRPAVNGDKEGVVCTVATGREPGVFPVVRHAYALLGPPPSRYELGVVTLGPTPAYRRLADLPVVDQPGAGAELGAVSYLRPVGSVDARASAAGAAFVPGDAPAYLVGDGAGLLLVAGPCAATGRAPRRRERGR